MVARLSQDLGSGWACPESVMHQSQKAVCVTSFGNAFVLLIPDYSHNSHKDSGSKSNKHKPRVCSVTCGLYVLLSAHVDYIQHFFYIMIFQ